MPKQNAIASAITPESLPTSIVTRLTRRPFAASSTIATMLRVMESSCIAASADARQLVADEHVDDPTAAEHGPHEDARLGALGDPPDDTRIGAQRMGAHSRNGGLRLR